MTPAALWEQRHRRFSVAGERQHFRDAYFPWRLGWGGWHGNRREKSPRFNPQGKATLLHRPSWGNLLFPNRTGHCHRLLCGSKFFSSVSLPNQSWWPLLTGVYWELDICTLPCRWQLTVRVRSHIPITCGSGHVGSPKTRDSGHMKSCS